MSLISADLPEPDASQLRDAVRAAEGVVRFHDEVLRAAVAEVQLLDGVLLAAWLRISGTRDRQLEAGIARVQVARAALAKAKATLDEAKAALSGAEARESVTSERARRRAELVEARADLLRGSHLPARRDLLQLESEIKLLSARITGYDEILQAATGLLAAAGAVMRRADLVEIDERHRHKRSRNERMGDELAVREGLVTLSDRAARVAKVARAVGAAGWEADEPDIRGMTVNEIADWVFTYRRRLRDQIEALGGERRTLIDRRKAVVAARVRLVNANDLHR
jgi:hypothetical protein